MEGQTEEGGEMMEEAEEMEQRGGEGKASRADAEISVIKTGGKSYKRKRKDVTGASLCSRLELESAPRGQRGKTREECVCVCVSSFTRVFV